MSAHGDIAEKGTVVVGTQPDFEVVRSAVAQSLRQQSYATALRQYLSLLAGQSQVEGIALDAADTPLVQ